MSKQVKLSIQGVVYRLFLCKNISTAEPQKSFSDVVSLQTANKPGNFKPNSILAKTPPITSKVARLSIKMKHTNET